MPERNPKFLHQKFKDLNASPEVESVVNREVSALAEPRAKQAKTNELMPQKPEARIQAYLNYLSECVSIEDPRQRTEKLSHIKQVLHEKYVTKQEHIPDSYWESIRRRHHEEGHGEIEIPDELKAKLASDIMTEQANSLNMWIDYLAGPDAAYPDWFKYFAFRSILRLNKYDKEKKQFTERTKGTVSPFPDLNREALALVCDALVKKQAGDPYDVGYDVRPEDKEKWQQYLRQESFAKMYAWAHEHFNPIPEELLQKTNGEWRTFPKGSDPQKLVDSISAYSTGWCIRGQTTAADYLSHSDLEVYFSEDKDGNYTIPRLVVVRRDNITQEVRGVAYQENHDEYIGEVVDSKLAALPDGQLWRKKSQDMKQMTAIYDKCFKVDRKTRQKTYLNPELNAKELRFLYEIDSPIKGFGYEDTRIREIRSQRNPKADAPIVFECKPKQIAYSEEEINEDTKVYVGPLFPNIFQTLKHIEYIYTIFPEGGIKRTTCETGGKTKDQLKQEMSKKKINPTEFAIQMMDNEGFSTTENSKQVDFVRLKVRDLFNDTNNHAIDEIYTKAKVFGLELCESEDGPNFRLHYTDQPQGEYIYMAMKQIAGAVGHPHVFSLHHGGGGLWLHGHWALPGRRLNSGHEFVFRLSKYEI